MALLNQKTHEVEVCLEFFGAGMDEAGAVIVALPRELPNRGEEALQALEHFDEQCVRAIGCHAKVARAEAPKAVLLIDLVAHVAAQLGRGGSRPRSGLLPSWQGPAGF